jgi:Uma2 family endonuclease
MTMLANKPRATPTPTLAPVLLATGDRMDQPTFHRLYSQTPPGFKAELVEGAVYVASPVSSHHSIPHARIMLWLGLYELATPSTIVCDNGTLVMNDANELQPDAMLLLNSSVGGGCALADGYVRGVPELVVEVSHTTESLDRVSKRRVYESLGVAEYLVVLVASQSVEWWSQTANGFVALKADRNGRFKSKAFPGLWLTPSGIVDASTQQLANTLHEGLASPDHARFVAKLARQRAAQ